MDFEKVKAEVKSLEEARNKEIADYTSKYEGAQKRRENALEEAEKAYSKAKVEDYHKAQEEARISGDAIKMYEAKLEELQKKPLITKAKFEEYYAAIAEHLAAIVAEDKDEVREIAKDLIEIKDNENAILNEGNNLIEHIQKNLLKDPCGVFVQNGTFVPMPNQVRKFKDFSVLEFLNFITQHTLIADLVPKPKSELRYWGKE